MFEPLGLTEDLDAEQNAGIDRIRRGAACLSAAGLEPGGGRVQRLRERQPTTVCMRCIWSVWPTLRAGHPVDWDGVFNLETK